MGLFGGTKIVEAPKPTSNLHMEREVFDEAGRYVEMSPEELALLSMFEGRLPGDMARVDAETAALGQRGEDLNVLDQAAFERSFQPALTRLMNQYRDLDQGILESLNSRGIGAGSEQEAYQRMLLGRDTKEQINNATLAAQQQAMNQKLQQYQARTAETNQANTVFDKTAAPVMNSRLTDANDRMSTRAGIGTSTLSARLGHQANMHQINTGRKMAGQQQLYGMIGGGLGALSAAAPLIFASDENLKHDIEEISDEDHQRFLDKLQEVRVSRWKYKEDPDQVEHVGGMVQDMPDEMLTPDKKHVDVINTIGVLTAAIQELDNRTRGGGFKSLMAMARR